jgi:hypothetical protein
MRCGPLAKASLSNRSMTSDDDSPVTTSAASGARRVLAPKLACAFAVDTTRRAFILRAPLPMEMSRHTPVDGCQVPRFSGGIVCRRRSIGRTIQLAEAVNALVCQGRITGATPASTARSSPTPRLHRVSMWRAFWPAGEPCERPVSHCSRGPSTSLDPSLWRSRGTANAAAFRSPVSVRPLSGAGLRLPPV